MRISGMAMVAGAVATCGVVPFASAQPINYGDFTGNTVTFVGVTENSITDATPLYESPTVVGDSLSFNPTGFGSFSQGAGMLDTTDGTLSVMICADNGNILEQLLWEEAGEYSLVDAFGNGTNFTSATVAANLTIEIIEVDGTTLGSVVNLSAQMLNFMPSGGSYNLTDDGPSALTPFSGSVVVDLEQALIDNGILFTNGVTKINVQLNNQLVTTSEAGTSAFIQKKDTDGIVMSIIPTPGTATLLALGGLGCLRRRR